MRFYVKFFSVALFDAIFVAQKLATKSLVKTSGHFNRLWARFDVAKSQRFRTFKISCNLAVIYEN